MALPLDASTVAMPQAKTATPSSSFDEGRFPAGLVLAERFRIIGLLGQGGMGEVYRANDKNQQLLARFHAEVPVWPRFEDPNQPPQVLGEMAEFPGADVLNKLDEAYAKLMANPTPARKE